MELSRRDALTALAAAGITATAGCGSSEDDGSETNTDDGSTEEQPDLTSMETLVAVGEVLYPSDVEVTEEFVETFMFGRITDEAAYEEELNAGIETLDGLAMDQHGEPFGSLDESQRVTLFEESELRSGDSVPDGSDIERVNYHILDELLFAFYSSPTGGEMVGNTNPRGYPGGFGYSPELTQ
jgi:hypothetical protein